VAVSCCGCADDDGGGDLSVGGPVVSLKGIKGAAVGDIVRVVVVGMLASKFGYSTERVKDRQVTGMVFFTCTVMYPNVAPDVKISAIKTRARGN
jgi:hypothetical protein